MITKEEILYFISHFQNPGTIQTFTNGCCYWFAKILDERFNTEDISGENIWYNGVNNHFATLIGVNLYDITGDLGNIKDLNDWERWDYYMLKDKLLTENIIKNCIYKIKEER